jgi:hypothetical protein
MQMQQPQQPQMGAQQVQMGAQPMYGGAQQAAPQQPQQMAAPSAGGWTCSCGTVNTGNFCMNCGTKKPEAPAEWTCSCGTVNKGNFCMNCGTKKPE